MEQTQLLQGKDRMKASYTNYPAVITVQAKDLFAILGGVRPDHLESLEQRLNVIGDLQVLGIPPADIPNSLSTDELACWARHIRIDLGLPFE